MAINTQSNDRSFGDRFGMSPARGAGRSRTGRDMTNDDLPTAEYWLNIGYVTEPNAEGNYGFVSLPMGIPLDTMNEANERVNNEELREFRGAQNDLHKQLLDAASKLKPGEDTVFECDNGLAIQIRRKNDEVESVDIRDNRFAKKLAFGAPKASQQAEEEVQN